MEKVALATPEEAYVLEVVDVSKTTTASDEVVWKRQNERGYVHGIYIEVSDPNAAIRLTVDGRQLSISDMTVAQLEGRGMDIPHPVFPYMLKNDSDNGIYNWLWTPRDERLSRYYNSIYLIVAAGTTCTGKVLFSHEGR